MYLGTVVEEAPAEEIYENPQHPYTKFFYPLYLVADPSKPERKRLIVEGEVASPINPTDSCFASCPYAEKRCYKLPPLCEVSPEHKVACFMIEQYLAPDSNLNYLTIFFTI